ncbi:MAG: hypothetical protein ACRDKI_09485 [Solirubrobacterales bacterium]
MNDQNDNRFEDRLLSELRQYVAARPQEAPSVTMTPTPVRSPGRRYRYAAAGATLAAIAGVAFLVGHDEASPAYAVETTDNGTISVEISSLEDASGLQSKLRAAGINAYVDYVPDGKACKGPRFKNDQGDGQFSEQGFAAKVAPTGANEESLDSSGGPLPPGGKGERHFKVKGGDDRELRTKRAGTPGTPPPGELKIQRVNGKTRFTIPVKQEQGKTLVIQGNSGANSTSVSVQIGAGEVNSCVLEDAPEPSGAFGAGAPFKK